MENISYHDIDKKIKVTHYLNKQEYEMLTQLYSAAIKQSNKKDKSELICEAIQILFKNEIKRLEKLLQEKNKLLNKVTERSQGLSVLVPLHKQKPRIFSSEELKTLSEFAQQREQLSEEVKEIEYLLYQYRGCLRKKGI